MRMDLFLFRNFQRRVSQGDQYSELIFPFYNKLASVLFIHKLTIFLMNKAKYLGCMLFMKLIAISSMAQFLNDSLPVSKNSISLNITPLLEVSGVHNTRGWFGIVYRRLTTDQNSRFKFQINQFEDTHVGTYNMIVFQDSAQTTTSLRNNDDSFQVGLGVEFGRFHKRFHIYTGLDVMWMHETGDFTYSPLNRFSSEFFEINPIPVGAIYYGNTPISEMDPSTFYSNEWKRTSWGVGVPLGASARISSRFEVSVQWMLQLWAMDIQSQRTDYYSGEITRDEGSDVMLNTRSGELLLTYSF
jgi:hypothetical protein